MTNNLRKKFWILKIVSILLNFGPLIYYIVRGFITAEIHNKITLGLTLVIVIIMTAISMMNHLVLKSRLWILLIGLYFALDYIMIPLIIIAVCQVLDELIINPIVVRLGTDLRTSKLMDKRLENG